MFAIGDNDSFDVEEDKLDDREDRESAKETGLVGDRQSRIMHGLVVLRPFQLQPQVADLRLQRHHVLARSMRGGGVAGGRVDCNQADENLEDGHHHKHAERGIELAAREKDQNETIDIQRNVRPQGRAEENTPMITERGNVSAHAMMLAIEIRHPIVEDGGPNFGRRPGFAHETAKKSIQLAKVQGDGRGGDQA